MNNKKPNRLYHRNVFWRDYFNTATYKMIFNVNDFSVHLYENRHGISIWSLNKIFDDIKNHKQRYYLYEVETAYKPYAEHKEQIVKACIRTQYDYDNDIIIVIDEKQVRTCWLNKTNDKHTTLNRRKYYYPKSQKPIDRLPNQ